jgi:cell division protein FtsI (penicillin-binding protein 3)
MNAPRPFGIAPRPVTTKKFRQPPINVAARLYVVLMVLVLGSSALIVRAVDVQVVRKDFYQEQGDARFLRDMPFEVSRGTIFDRNGEPLAVSTPVESIWASPQELLEHEERLPELAKALGVDADSLKQKLNQRADKEFLYLKRHLNPDAAAEIVKLGIPGVSSRREFRRFYPSGEVMAHVLGKTNIDDRGQEGLELAFDEVLAGTPGSERVIRDLRGNIVEEVELTKTPIPGRDITLSIDRRIQYLAYRELKSAIIERHATSGSMVILDVRNGEVLAMVNQPSFNPNMRENVDASYRRNRAVTDVVEPGSTMKAFTISAALESGKWKPESKIDTSPGTYEIAGHIIRDTHNHGLLNLTGVITKSSNVGAAKIAETLPRDNLYDMFHRFGFGESTGSGFPGESPGFLPISKAWGPVEKATISYGYGLNITPLQLAQAYTAIANEGRMRAPTFVKDAQNPDSAIIDPQIAHTIMGMLRTVVSPEGTAQLAAVPNYVVAGKTGTARIAHEGGYQNRYISLFAGIVPATAPRLVAVVVINDPSGAGGNSTYYYGGFLSAPVFSKVMDGALRILDVPPDNVQRWYAGGPDVKNPATNVLSAVHSSEPPPSLEATAAEEEAIP